MAVADTPGLLDIASTLVPDDIPFKLRCATCNKLAVNAFRLPCCDQSICEPCQASLSNTCPVCTHTPVSPDLCKPNKALRTTLKAFLRTEEKKREKDRQSAAPPTPSTTTPDTKGPEHDANSAQNGVETVPVAETEVPHSSEPLDPKPEGTEIDTSVQDTAEISASAPAPETADQPAQAAATSLNGTDPTVEPATEAGIVTDSAVDGDSVPVAQDSEADPNSVAPDMAGNMAMGWHGNGMNPFMAGMFNYPNTMGMPMGMGPMANQGMFGGYGMNMTGMGMNAGMNYNGGMYGSLGWDASQQNNNMWQGGQNKFNPNAFANGTGPPYGGAFGGSNMSAYPSHSDYQSGYYGGYGRGGFRGRGRGQFHGAGRGGFGPMQGHYRQGANPGYANQIPSAMGDGPDSQMDAQGNVQTDENVPESGEPAPGSGNADDIPENTDQPQGIPTIESLDNSVPTGPTYGHMNSGYGQYRYGRHGQERGPGVEGAPAAPRAMREGLPNTSVLRQRGFQIQGRADISGEPNEEDHTRATSRPLSQRAQSRSRSPSENPASRPRSASVQGAEDGRDSHRNEIKRMDRVDELQSRARHSRSPSRTSSRRSSRRRYHESDREKDRRTSHRSQRSRRHRSRSRSSSRNGDYRTSDRLEKGTDRTGSNGRTKAPSEAPESRDLASRIGNSYRSSKDRGSRREDDRSRDQERDSRRRDRERDRDRDRERDRDRDRDRRARDRDSDRDRRRDSERDRDRPRERERDRKRSRRDRSPSANGSDHPQSRRVKHDGEDRSRGTNGTSTKTTESEKDPYTLEREARNKERLEREKQHRDKAKSGRRRDNRQDRVVAGRRINYKYEDEL